MPLRGVEELCQQPRSMLSRVDPIPFNIFVFVLKSEQRVRQEGGRRAQESLPPLCRAIVFLQRGISRSAFRISTIYRSYGPGPSGCCEGNLDASGFGSVGVLTIPASA